MALTIAKCVTGVAFALGVVWIILSVALSITIAGIEEPRPLAESRAMFMASLGVGCFAVALIGSIFLAIYDCRELERGDAKRPQ